MGRGYPDYFGYSMFPTYGKMLRDNLPTTNIPNGSTLEAFSISSKSILQGGFIGISGSSNSPNIFIRITIDGDVAVYQALDIMYLYNLAKMDCSLVYLLTYSPITTVYSVGFKRLIPVEYEYKIEIVNNTAYTLTVFGDLNYSNIQT